MLSPHFILLILALACTFCAFINKPTLPVNLGWLAIFLLILDQLIGH